MFERGLQVSGDRVEAIVQAPMEGRRVGASEASLAWCSMAQAKRQWLRVRFRV